VAKQGVFGLVVGIGCPADQGEIYRDAIDIPLGHEEDDPKAKDVRMIPAEPRFVGYWVLGAPLAFERTVADQIEDAILGRRQGLQGLLGEPPQQRLRAPIGGTQQTAILLVGQMGRAMSGQSLHVGPVAIDHVQDQQPAEDQLVPMAETGLQDPQMLRDAAGQTGQEHGPGLLGDTRSDGLSRSSILGSAWIVKDFHA
jgi:hypothetical protein